MITLLCEVFQAHRSSYKYRLLHPYTIKPWQAKELSAVKAVYEESQGSAGARTIATIATVRDVPLSIDRAGKLMKKPDIQSCQLPNHRYKKSASRTY